MAKQADYVNNVPSGMCTVMNFEGILEEVNCTSEHFVYCKGEPGIVFSDLCK